MEPNTFYCKICKVPLNDKNAFQIHLQSKKHKKAQQKISALEKKGLCGVFVTGFPHSVKLDELQIYFSKFGNVTSITFGPNKKYLLLEYAKPEMAKHVLSVRHMFLNRILVVRQRTVKKDDQDATPASEDLRTLVKALTNAKTIEDQLNTLTQMICPEFQSTSEKYALLVRDLENALRTIFPNCTVYTFGSTVTGLCFKSSDVDAYVKIIPSKDPNVGNLIKKARTALARCREFSHIFGIPKAKTPIVKCVHMRTGLSCDFNFKNMLGVCNSHLIRYYLSLDCRLTQVMIALKFWAKVHDLSGVNKFSNYALVLLFVFYLQQEPYRFPSVVELQTDPSFSKFQEGWNGGFKPLENFASEAIAHASIETIMSGFFKFCADFDYNTYVICPYIAKTIPKIEFFKPGRLPSVYERYKTSETPLNIETCVCIQDPFEHTHNTTSSVPVTKLQEFVAYCKLAGEIFENSKKENKNILRELITCEAEIVETRKVTFDDKVASFNFAMGHKLLYLYKKLDDDENGSIEDLQQQMRSLWYDTVNQFIISILISVLKLRVVVQKTEETFAKLQKLSGQTDVCDTDVVDTVTFHCSGKLNLWEARKPPGKEANDINGRVLERESAVSELICKSIADIKLTDDIIEFDLVLNAKVNPTEVEFIVKKVSAVNKGVFKTLCSFFAARVTHWFDVYVKELNDEAKCKGQESEG